MKTIEKKEIGINIVGGCGSVKKTLHLIKMAGFKHVMPFEDGKNLESLLIQTKSAGLNVPYVHLAYKKPCGVNFLWTGTKKREKLVKSLIRRIEICSRYGIEAAVVHCARRVNEFRGTFNKAVGLESIKQLVAAAEKYKVKLAFENLSIPENFFLQYIFDNIKSPWLGFCYDCGHHYLHDDETDYKKYGKMVFAIHLHDNFMGANSSDVWSGDMHLLPGDGKIDFEKVMTDIALTSYRGVLMLEVSKAKLSKYRKMSPLAFLQEAYKKGEGLADILSHTKKTKASSKETFLYSIEKMKIR